MNEMPKIDVGALPLSPKAKDLVRRIVHRGRLRATKPKVTYHRAGRDEFGRQRYEPDYVEGCAAYVWRMVAFYTSPKRAHQCMPVTADFSIPGELEEVQNTREELDAIVDVVVDSIPRPQWHGVIRWGQAFGMVGSPRYTSEGTVVYR